MPPQPAHQDLIVQLAQFVLLRHNVLVDFVAAYKSTMLQTAHQLLPQTNSILQLWRTELKFSRTKELTILISHASFNHGRTVYQV